MFSASEEFLTGVLSVIFVSSCFPSEHSHAPSQPQLWCSSFACKSHFTPIVHSSQIGSIDLLSMKLTSVGRMFVANVSPITSTSLENQSILTWVMSPSFTLFITFCPHSVLLLTVANILIANFPFSISNTSGLAAMPIKSSGVL